MKPLVIPNDGIEGLKENWRSDAVSGFLIFLIAMPLCLAVSKASGFPPIAGIYTAIIGGLLVSLFMGARLTIKGPAAGLISISIAAVEELGRGDAVKGYKLALAAIVVASLIQILFGFLKAGKLSDFFPSSAVHGMLAGIGIIIIAKQIPVLLGAEAQGSRPLELLAQIPALLLHMNPQVFLIGLISMLMLFLLPMMKTDFFKILPPPMMVLIVAIPMAGVFQFGTAHDYTMAQVKYHIIPGNELVQLPDSFFGGITMPDFSEIFSLVSIKYIIMFALVGSLESIMSAKAIDLLDPYKRKSDLNKDILSVGIGNAVAGFIGGLPMISEIVRSSANINNGAKTRWANFLHGLFLLGFVTLAANIIEMIPNAALAAMLIYTGFKLASPAEFKKTWLIGWDQFLIFVVTVIVTLATDLLLGILSGVALQLVLLMLDGVSLKSLFKANFEISRTKDQYYLAVKNAAVFSNYLSLQKELARFEPEKTIVLDFAEAPVVDHTYLERLHQFEEDYHYAGGNVIVQGLERHAGRTAHPLATRRILTTTREKISRLNHRQNELQLFAEENGFDFTPATVANPIRYRGFTIEKGLRITYDQNVLSKARHDGKLEISDITLTGSTHMAQRDLKITAIVVSDLSIAVPDLILEPEHLWTKLAERTNGKDIDFTDHREFSKKYYLRGHDEKAIREFFSEGLITFLQARPAMHVESSSNRIMIYKRHGLLGTGEIRDLIDYTEGFLEALAVPILNKADVRLTQNIRS